MKKNCSIYRDGNKIVVTDSKFEFFGQSECGKDDVFSTVKGIRLAAMRLFAYPEKIGAWYPPFSVSGIEFIFSAIITIPIADIVRFAENRGARSVSDYNYGGPFGFGTIDEYACGNTGIKIVLV